MTDEIKGTPGAGVWRSLGDFIRGQRELANPMRQLAEIAEISNRYLSQVERGLYKPSAEVLKEHRQRAAYLGGNDLHPSGAPRRHPGTARRAITASNTRSSWTRA